MPTGYTAVLLEKEGVTFPQFALRCARAFGACVMQRDDPLDALPNPAIAENSSYYHRRLQEIQEEVSTIESLQGQELLNYVRNLEDETFASKLVSYESIMAENQKFQNMLQEVHKWTPPTADYVELKNFMIQQLEASIFSHVTPPPPIVRQDPEPWKEEKLLDLRREAARMQETIEEEKTRNTERVKWITDLYKALDYPIPEQK